jgi:excisionase family DNA binding protein
MSDELLTIAEAAERLGVSRPYASMLADTGKLGAVAEKDGRRAVAVAAVEEYLRARAQEHAGAKTPREAAAEANLYELESLAGELGVPVETLRMFAAISDPANQHLFTREALAKALERNLASSHVTSTGGNVFADLGFNADEAQRLLEDADERLIGETVPSLAEKGGSDDTDVAFDPPPVDIKAKPADLDD